MSIEPAQRSATIYQFPAGGRVGLGARRAFAQPAAEIASLPRTEPVVASGAWYHDAAIQDSKRAGEL